MIIAHTAECPVNVKHWRECTCGLIEQVVTDGRAKYVEHTQECPSHCTCDFNTRLLAHLSGSRLTLEEYRQRYRARLMTRGLDPETADATTEAAEPSQEDLDEGDPEGDADNELSYWDNDV